MSIWDQIPSQLTPPLPPEIQLLWVWALVDGMHIARQHFPTFFPVASFDKTNPVLLLTTQDAINACTTDQLLRLHDLFQHEGRSYLQAPPPPLSDQVLRALDIQIATSLDEKQLGGMGDPSTNICYLPYTQHPSLQMARYLCHVHTWYTSLTPLGSIVYLVFHVYLHLVYLAVASSAHTATQTYD